MATGRSFDEAILINLNSNFEMTVSSSNRYAYFQIDVIEGVPYKFTTDGDGDLLAYLYDYNQKQLAYDDDSGSGTNPLLSFTPSYTGKMVIRVNAYSSSSYITFRAIFMDIVVEPGESFDVAIEIIPDEKTQILEINSLLTHTYFKANLKIGTEYIFESHGISDVYAAVYNENRSRIANDDDGGLDYNFKIKFKATSTVTYFEIGKYNLNGGNRLEVSLKEPDPSGIERVEVYPERATVTIGRTIQLGANVIPYDAPDPSVYWYSSAPFIATVDDNGLVTGIDSGEVAIYAVTNVGAFQSYSVITVVAGQGSGGQGTESDPILVYTADQLKNVFDREDVYFRQMADIDLSNTRWHDYALDGPPDPFSGVYDGNGYKIKHLGMYYHEGYTYADSVFGYVTGTIKNVTVEGINIVGFDKVAGLCGVLSYGKLINCHASVHLSGQRQVGGLVGSAQHSEIINCSSTGVIYATGTYFGVSGTDVGGLVGETNNTTIENSFSTVDISLDTEDITYNTGGLVGKAYQSWIRNSYSSGNIEGSHYVGGLIGELSPTALGSSDRYFVENCYSSGIVTGVSNVSGFAGRFVDYLTNMFRIKKCFVLVDRIDSSGNASDLIASVGGFSMGMVENSYRLDGIEGSFSSYLDATITRQQAKQQSTYENVGWDFDSIWTIDEDNSYPTLIPMKSMPIVYARAIPLSRLTIVVPGNSPPHAL